MKPIEELQSIIRKKFTKDFVIELLIDKLNELTRRVNELGDEVKRAHDSRAELFERFSRRR